MVAPRTKAQDVQGIDVLPDALLLEVFSYLSVQDRIHVAALVCRQWLRVLRSPCGLWTFTRCCLKSQAQLHDIKEDEASRNAARFLDWLLPRAPSVRSLALNSSASAELQTGWPRTFAKALRCAGPFLRQLEINCTHSASSPEAISRLLHGLQHCRSLTMLSLGGEVCMRALTLADTTATLVHFASLKTLRLRSTGTTLPSVIASWTTLEILEIKVAGPEEPTAGKIKHWHTALAYRRQAEVITLQLPEELSQLTALRALCVDFADRRLGMHPGLCSRLEAPAQLSQLGKLESLRLRQCSLVGGGWRHVWPGLTSLTDLRFNSCLGSSLSQELPYVCAAALPLQRLEVTDPHAVTVSAPLVDASCLQLSRLAGTLRELVWSNQRCLPDLARLTNLTSIRASNTVDTFLEAVSQQPCCLAELYNILEYHPIMSRIYAGGWVDLQSLRVLDFSHTDDLAVCDLPWARLPNLEKLVLSDVKRLNLSACDDLAGLAALPYLAVVDLRNSVPSDSQTMGNLFNLAFAMRTGSGHAKLLM